MDLKNFFAVLFVSLAILGIALLLPDSQTEDMQSLPWQIEQEQNTTRVFGITLGVSTLSDAEKLFLGDGEISLFHTNKDTHVVEAYFDKVELGGLTAKMILVMDIPESELSEMYQRGVRISKLGSGSNKVSIATEDLHRTRNSAVASITYLPSINLSAEQIKARFGEPKERIKEPETDIEHWLYPTLGLDILLSEEAKEVLQYVNPSAFSTISQPLKNLEKDIK